MTSTGAIGRKFSIRMSSNGIINEKICAICAKILFYGEVFSAFCFYARKAIISLFLQKFDPSLLFGRRATPLTLFYWKKLYIIWFDVRNPNISQVFKYWIKLLLLNCNLKAKIFFTKWPVAKLLLTKPEPPVLFYGKCFE